MNVFGSGHSTVGAGKSGAQSTRRFGPDTPLFFALLALLLLLVSPLAAVVYLAAALLSQARRIRWSRFVLAAAIASGVGAAVAGFDPVRAFRWHTDGTLSIWTPTGVFGLLQSLVDEGARILEVSTYTIPLGELGLASAIVHTSPIAVPTGLWLAAFYAFWTYYRRAPLSELEGKQFDWSRPEGFFDQVRRTRNRRKIAAGRAVKRKRGAVAVGVGRYGVIVWLFVASMQRPTLAFGGPRQGKTQHGLNTIAQAAGLEGGAWIIIDFKGDDEVPAYAAEFAAARGRRFLHFKTADKNGAAYRQPHPGVPDRPAFYDPLRSGNATSKTDMLVNSVGRDGDAAAYFRAAYELTQVVYQVAALSGYDRDKGGFRVLEDLLDVDRLQQVADTVGPDGRGVLADHPDLAARVEKMVANEKRDNIGQGAGYDLKRLLSTYGNGPAAGPWLRPGPTPAQNIDLYRAVHDGDVVVFSLSVQDYGNLAKDIGTLVLLDLQNAIARLRTDLGNHRAKVGDPSVPPPWAPAYVQIEEFGSAGPDAVLDVLNKSGDVQIRPWLSTQSLHDIIAVDGTGTFARRVIDQADNIFSFAINEPEAATSLSGLTPEVMKQYPRDRKEFSGGLMGMGLKAANTGAMEVTRETERQVPAGAFQNLSRYSCIWVTKSPTLRATHSHKATANHWWEVVSTVPIPPDAGAKGVVADWHPPTTAQEAPPVPLDEPATPTAPSPAPVQSTAPALAESPDSSDSPGAPTPEQAPEPTRTSEAAEPRPTPARRAFAKPSFGPGVTKTAPRDAEPDGPPLPEPDPPMGETEQEPPHVDAERDTEPVSARDTKTAKGGLDLDGFDEFG